LAPVSINDPRVVIRSRHRTPISQFIRLIDRLHFYGILIFNVIQEKGHKAVEESSKSIGTYFGQYPRRRKTKICTLQTIRWLASLA
jgi:hypothetical protein